MRREIRQAIRSLLRAPAAAAVSVLTMAVGLGASVAVLALVDAVVLRPLPYPQPEQLVRIFDVNQASAVDRSGIATGDVFEWLSAARGFAGIAGTYKMGSTAGVGSVAFCWLTPRYFASCGSIFCGLPAMYSTTMSSAVITPSLL